MNWLAEGMKKLPSNLQDFILELSSNKIGGNGKNLKWLEEGMK